MNTGVFHILAGVLITVLCCNMQWQTVSISMRNRIMGSRAMFALALYTGMLSLTVGILLIMNGIRTLLMAQ